MSSTGETIETVEVRWGQSIDLMFDTPEAKAFAPDPSMWPAYLNAGAARVGHFRPPLGKIMTPVVEVRVNCGVWQTVCPFCPSAQHASKTDRWFYCARCHNDTVGQMLVPVVWPEETLVGDIEGLLLERPYIDYRSWEPDQTPDDIANENEAMRAERLPAPPPRESK